MARYEPLPTIVVSSSNTTLPTQQHFELVHLEDPANYVMTDFTLRPPHTIAPIATMNDAIGEMKISHVHTLLVIDEQGHFQGVISSEDTLGAKPIQLMQESRLPRENILVKMLMTPCSNVTAIDIETIETASVGHIVKTLQEHNQTYALAVAKNGGDSAYMICGIFTASQISKQLHQDLRDIL